MVGMVTSVPVKSRLVVSARAWIGLAVLLVVSQFAAILSTYALCALPSGIWRKVGSKFVGPVIVDAEWGAQWRIREWRTPLSRTVSSELISGNADATSVVGGVPLDLPYWCAATSIEGLRSSEYASEIGWKPSFTDVAYGFPFLTLALRRDETELAAQSEKEVRDWINNGRISPAPEPVYQIRTLYGWSPNSTHWIWRVFPRHSGVWPTRLLWPGYLLESLFWCVIFIALYFVGVAWGRFKRARREAGGQCDRCGYPQVGLSPDRLCPECGARPEEQDQARFGSWNL